MIRQAFMATLTTFVLGIAIAMGGVTPALARDPAAIVLAIPANRSEKLSRQLKLDIARLYADAQPGDRFVFVNASNQGVLKDVLVPAELGDTDRDRDDALLDLFAPVSRFLAINDPTVPADNLNIPMTLRAIGLTVLPRFGGKKPNVILFGSMNWENRRDATWSFKTHLVLDGFLNERGGPFGVIGEENVLGDALVSILFNDEPDAFITTGAEKHVEAFWAKSIKARGARLGAIEAYAPDSYARLFASTQDTTPYLIDPKAPRAIVELGFNRTKVIQAGQPLPAPKPAAVSRSGSNKPASTKPDSRPAPARTPTIGSDAGG